MERCTIRSPPVIQFESPKIKPELKMCVCAGLIYVLKIRTRPNGWFYFRNVCSIVVGPFRINFRSSLVSIRVCIRKVDPPGDEYFNGANPRFGLFARWSWLGLIVPKLFANYCFPNWILNILKIAIWTILENFKFVRSSDSSREKCRNRESESDLNETCIISQ